MASGSPRRSGRGAIAWLVAGWLVVQIASGGEPTPVRIHLFQVGPACGIIPGAGSGQTASKYDGPGASRPGPTSELAAPDADVICELPPPEQMLYVAMGDSFSSGEGSPNPFDDSKCHRSRSAYAARLAEAAPMKGFGFFACTGARIADILTQARFREPPQIRLLPAATSLLTLSIGGNDIGFSKILLTCLSPLRCDKRYGAKVAGLIRGLALSVLYYDLQEAAPRALIAVVGYPQVFSVEGPLKKACWFLAPQERAWIWRTADQLNDAIESATMEASALLPGHPRILFVPVPNALAGHEACTRDSWVNGVVLKARHPFQGFKGSFHPNECGQYALFQLVAADLRQSAGLILLRSPARPSSC
jgi:lysophospholipase L1-like esterase